MNIPLEKLYDFLESFVDRDVIIYRFLPHGSKNLEDLHCLKSYQWGAEKWFQALPMIMHDQEPLNFDLYCADKINPVLDQWIAKNNKKFQHFLSNTTIRNQLVNLNLAFIRHGITVYDQRLLVHSELNSSELTKYEQLGMRGVYWWAHAVIARDWYRYAEVDADLQQLPHSFEKTFNIYNRAWSGTREYRLKLADMIIDQQLVPYCNLRFNPSCDGTMYQMHEFKNPAFVPQHALEQLPLNLNTPTASADYSSVDYQQCWFDVVLETLFDDTRLQLTEKILRPIACGKPFILAGTAGGLEYLKHYGFRTFGDFIDESYDTETDPLSRLSKIVSLMQSIQSLTPVQKQQLSIHLTTITNHNRERFFSNEFMYQVCNEFAQNYQAARQSCHRTGHQAKEFLSLVQQHQDLNQYLENDVDYKVLPHVVDYIA